MRQPSPFDSVGFTGTRQGMSDDQWRSLREKLEQLRPRVSWFHHGDCIGADAEAAEIARSLGYLVAVHPPDDESRRAFTKADYSYTPAPYHDRNRGIVNESMALIATPKTMNERVHSGTWYTIRYAKQIARPVYILARTVEREMVK